MAFTSSSRKQAPELTHPQKCTVEARKLGRGRFSNPKPKKEEKPALDRPTSMFHPFGLYCKENCLGLADGILRGCTYMSDRSPEVP